MHKINEDFLQVPLLLMCFIFLFNPIYKHIYLTIIKLDIFENRKILFHTFFFSHVFYRKFVFTFLFRATILITTLIRAQNASNMFSLTFAGLFILIKCIRYMTSTFSDEFFVYSTLE